MKLSAFAVCSSSVVSVSRHGSQVPPSITKEHDDNFVPPIGDLRFTPYQMELGKKLGLDVNHWAVDPNANRSRDAWFENSPWNKLWSNPAGYDGTNLRIPYRFQAGSFTPDMVKDISIWLEELGGYVNGCIEFYNDTMTRLYDSKYILIRNIDDDGSYDPSCWSLLGSVTEGNGDTYQSFNVGKEGCMWRHTVQHEMLHALGFLHEMARPDRDNYVVIHWDNIDPIFHNQYHKMNNLTWEDYGEKYDLKSIMHYEGWAFAKQEALDKDEFAMTNRATGEGVVVEAPFLSSIDAVQLAKRYREFCSVPETKKCPGSLNDYYLKGRECNGWIDCPGARDEDFEFCGDRGCGIKLNVEGSGHFDGLYELEQGYHNNRPYYSTPRGSGKFYLYTNEGNGNWQFNPILGSGSAYSYTDNGAECPADGIYYHWIGSDGWEVLPEFRVNVIEYAPSTITSTTTSTTTPTTTSTTTSTTMTTTTMTTTTSSTSTSTPSTTSTTSTFTTTTEQPPVDDGLNAADCAGTVDYKFRSGKAKVSRSGENSNLVRLQQAKVKETKAHTGFVSFPKSACGKDFLAGLKDGRVTVDFADKKATYSVIGSYYVDNGSSTQVVVQYNSVPLNVADDKCPKCLGNSSTDQLEMLVMGTKNIEWGSKTAKSCLNGALVGHAGAAGAPTLLENDESGCVAWTNAL